MPRPKKEEGPEFPDGTSWEEGAEFGTPDGSVYQLTDGKWEYIRDVPDKPIPGARAEK
jgi:hypothetical protein